MLLHVGGTSFSGTGGFTRLNISVKHVFDMSFPPIMSHQNPLFKGCMLLAPNVAESMKHVKTPPTFRRRSADILLTYPVHGSLTYLGRADVRRHPTNPVLPRSSLTPRRHSADVRSLYFLDISVVVYLLRI